MSDSDSDTCPHCELPHAIVKSSIAKVVLRLILKAIQAIGSKTYVEISAAHPSEGRLEFLVTRQGGESSGDRADRYEQMLKGHLVPVPYAKWTEQDGDVLWWHFDESGRVTESPWVGSPLDCGQTVECILAHHTGGTGEIKETKSQTEVGGWPGYHTHFTRIPAASLSWRPSNNRIQT